MPQIELFTVRRLRKPNTWAMSLALPVLMTAALHAQQSPAAPATAESVEENASLDGDVFPIPEGGVEELFQFVEEIVKRGPGGESESEQTAHQRKVARTIAVVADKALSLKPTNEQAVQGHFFRLQALDVLGKLGEPKAESLLDKAIATARADASADVVAVGMKFFLESNFAKWPALGNHQKTMVVDEVAKYLTDAELQPWHVQMLMEFIEFLDEMDDSRLASDLLEQTLPHFRKSQQPAIQQSVASLEGLHRRFNLLGKKMAISGTLLDDTEIDWASYRGKIVLVDFWATWCGPCRRELPNVLKLYEAYHDKGFEVVGICLDAERESIDAFVENTPIPWATIFSENDAKRGWGQPLAEYYGVTGVPRAILVDRDGTVVSMSARGEELARQLRKRLGEPLAKSGENEKAIVRQVLETAAHE